MSLVRRTRLTSELKLKSATNFRVSQSQTTIYNVFCNQTLHQSVLHKNREPLLLVNVSNFHFLSVPRNYNGKAFPLLSSRMLYLALILSVSPKKKNHKLKRQNFIQGSTLKKRS